MNDNEKLMFGGFEVTFEMDHENNDLLINCKGVQGRLSEVSKFYNGEEAYFDEAKIRYWFGNAIRIDCLKDTKFKFDCLYAEALNFFNRNNK